METRNIYDIKKLELTLDDALIVKMPEDRMSTINVQILSKMLTKTFPDHSETDKILILPDYVDLSVIKTQTVNQILLGLDEHSQRPIKN